MRLIFGWLAEILGVEKLNIAFLNLFNSQFDFVFRNDKTAETATNLQELENLYTASKQHMDVDLEMGTFITIHFVNIFLFLKKSIK